MKALDQTWLQMCILNAHGNYILYSYTQSAVCIYLSKGNFALYTLFSSSMMLLTNLILSYSCVYLQL